MTKKKIHTNMVMFSIISLYSNAKTSLYFCLNIDPSVNNRCVFSHRKKKKVNKKMLVIQAVLHANFYPSATLYSWRHISKMTAMQRQ